MKEEHCIKDIEISKAVRASCSFPVLYSPLKYEEHMFVDGGVLNNIPVREVRQMGAGFVIAVGFTADQNDEKMGLYNIGMKAVDIMSAKMSEEVMKESDFIIEPKVGDIKILDSNKIKECYERGYSTASKKISEIKEKIG